MDTESSTKFIGSLTKFLQSLCNGYVEFDDGVELIGHIYLSVDAGKTGKTLNYFLNEKVCKNDNSVTFISNSFHAQAEKSKEKDGENRKADDDIPDSGDNVPRSTNAGTMPFRPQGSRSGASPNQHRMGMPVGTKRPGSPLKGPPSQRRAPTPPSQRRFQSSGSRGAVGGSPVSKTVPSSPSSSSQDNAPSPSPARRSREISQPTSNQSDNVGADNENDIPPNVLSINPTPEFASFLGSLTSDNQTSQDQHSPPDTKPDTDVTFIKEEYVSEPTSCAQSGSSGQHSGRSGEDSSGLYPVMLHQNPSVFPGSSGYSNYQGGASSTATSQQPAFPGSSQSDFSPVPGTSQDGADPSGKGEEEDVYLVYQEHPDGRYYISRAAPTQQPPWLQEEPSRQYEATEDGTNSSSSGTIDTPITFSVGDHSSESRASMLDVKPDVSALNLFSGAAANSFHAHSQPMFPGPHLQGDDVKYDMSHFLLSSYNDGNFNASRGKRKVGRPRKSMSRVTPYGDRTSAMADQGPSGPNEPHRGSGRGQRALRRSGRARGRGRGAVSAEKRSESPSAVSPPSGGISASLLGGAIRGKDGSGRRGRGMRALPLQKGRGFLSLKNMMTRKYSYLPQDQRGRGQGRARGLGRGGARLGAGRPRKNNPALTRQLQPDVTGTSQPTMDSDDIMYLSGNPGGFIEVKKEKGQDSFYSSQIYAGPGALSGRGQGRGGLRGPRGGRPRRAVGRPRKHPGPSGRVTPALSSASGDQNPGSLQRKEEATDDAVVQALVNSIKRESAALLAKRPYRKRGTPRGPGQRRPSKTSELSVRSESSPNSIHNDITDEPRDGMEENTPILAFDDVVSQSSVSFPGPSSVPLQTVRGKNSTLGRRRLRGRVSALAGRGRGRLGVSPSRGRGRISVAAQRGRSLARSFLRRARGSRGRRAARILTAARVSDTISVKEEPEDNKEFAATKVGHFRGRGRRALGRRGSFTAVRSRGVRGRGRGLGRPKPMPALVKQEYDDDTEDGDDDFTTTATRGGRGTLGRGLSPAMPALPKEEKPDGLGDGKGEGPLEVKPMECPQCGKRYEYRACLVRHVQSCRDNPPSSSPSSSSTSHTCILCDQTFSNLALFKSHGQEEHGIEEDDVMMLEKK